MNNASPALASRPAYRVASEGRSKVVDETTLYAAVRLARAIATIDGTMVNVWSSDRNHRAVAFAQPAGAVRVSFGATAGERAALANDWQAE